MNPINKLKYHLFFSILILLVSFIWALISGYMELYCLKENGWFARSGAILVVFAIWSGLITRPFVYDESFPDLVKIYKGETEEEHWLKKYKVFNLLLIIEIILAFLGTLIWAYGDLWLPRC